MREFSLKILGTSASIPTSKNFLSSCVVKYNESYYLIDCGEATQFRLFEYKIPIMKINNIFISHLHGDHYFGLFGLLSTYQLLNRTGTLNIYAFEELKPIIEKVIGKDFQFNINYFNLNNSYEKIYEDKNIEVFSFPLKHTVKTCGFIFAEKPQMLKIKKEKINEYKLSISDIRRIKAGEDYITNDGKIIPNAELTYPPLPLRKFAYLIDTSYEESYLNYLQGVTTLLCDSTFLQKDLELAQLTGHCTSRNAALIASKINANTLILSHFSTRYKNKEDFYLEAKEIFKNVIIAEEGIRIEVN
ncbi:MAG: ribonuclease Z [Bacteroidales bacterium]|nr:ribonuclease Z [Bacteroidales bacterium]